MSLPETPSSRPRPLPLPLEPSEAAPGPVQPVRLDAVPVTHALVSLNVAVFAVQLA
ncbi:MAG: hypothetical protein JOZ69_09165, partial [Myxococcales bacterium]|nr:hypothetical protein [Myxococcales bacterium]